MSSKLKDFTRRGFLRGAGKLILPLPILNCMLNTNGTAYAQGTPIQPFFMYAINGLSVGGNGRAGARLLANGNGYEAFGQDGRNANNYFPTRFGNLGGIDLPFAMRPLNNFKNDFNLITNLHITRGGNVQGAVSNAGENIPHHSIGLYVLMSGDGDYYTGSTKTITTTSGDQIRRTNSNVSTSMTSADHYVHERLGSNGRLLSLHVEKERHGSGTHEAISWKNGNLKDYEPLRDLTTIYNTLFQNVAQGTTVTETAKNANQIKREGILSLIMADYKEVSKLVGREDRTALQSHLSKIEQLEKDVRAVASAAPVSASCNPPGRPNINDNVQNNYGNEVERAKLMNNMIAIAASCRVAQVMSYGITHSRSGMRPAALTGFVSNPNYDRTQKTPDMHSLTHDGNPEAVQTYKEVHNWQVSVYADLINRFKQIRIGDDNLLDYSNLLYVVESGHGKSFETGSDWHAHSLHNMVAMNAGGRRLGIKLGNHINGTQRHPMRIVNSMMKAMKIQPGVGKVTQDFSDII